VRSGGGPPLGADEYEVTSVTEARTARGARVSAVRTRGSASPSGSPRPGGGGVCVYEAASTGDVGTAGGGGLYSAAMASAALDAAYAYAHEAQIG
jgi:hypothetical protein